MSVNCFASSVFRSSDFMPSGHFATGVVSNDQKTKLWVANGTIFESDRCLKEGI